MMLQTRSHSKHSNSSQTGPSKVLLVCIYDTIALDITNQILYQKFMEFGHIVKLLIFQKSQVTKCFVEYDQTSQAIEARQNLNGTKLYGNICKMNIYFSAFSNVDLRHQTTQGINFTGNQKDSDQFLSRYDQLTRSSPQKDQDEFNDLLMESFQSPFSRSKTDCPQMLESMVKKVNQKSDYSSIESQLDKSIHNNINLLLEPFNETPKTKHHSSQKSSQVSSPIKIKQTSKAYTNVLAFAYKKTVEIREVYNLFSNFGNIAAIIKKKDNIFVKFRSIEFASISYTYLNNYRFLGNHLTLQSPMNQMDAMPREEEWSQCVFYDSSFDRFTEKKSITINSPSNTLHVSSLKRDICNEQTLYDIFGKYGGIEYVHILKQSMDKRMALVKYYSIEDSFRAVGALHNEMFSGRKMQISFTKPRS